MCRAFANLNACAVSSIKKPGARHRSSHGAWHKVHSDAQASPALTRATAKIQLGLQRGSDRQYDLVGQQEDDAAKDGYVDQDQNSNHQPMANI